MKAANKSRLLEIAQRIKRRARLSPPLLVFHDAPTLPSTSAEEIETARMTGRPIANVYFENPAVLGDHDVTTNLPDRTN